MNDERRGWLIRELLQIALLLIEREDADAVQRLREAAYVMDKTHTRKKDFQAGTGSVSPPTGQPF